VFNGPAPNGCTENYTKTAMRCCRCYHGTGYLLEMTTSHDRCYTFARDGEFQQTLDVALSRLSASAGGDPTDAVMLGPGRIVAVHPCPFSHFIPYSLRESVALCLKRQCDRTLGDARGAPAARPARAAARGHAAAGPRREQALRARTSAFLFPGPHRWHKRARATLFQRPRRANATRFPHSEECCD
jgi:hypothetical protein